MATKVLFLLLLVDRDGGHTKTPVLVPEWEQPILEEIHGELAVTEVEGGSREGTTELNAAEIYGQLLNKYSQRQDAVKTAFRKPGVLAKQYGLPWTPGDDVAARQQAALVIENPIPPVEPTDGGEGGNGGEPTT